MKKLMIAAAIVCAAALSHGAACSWEVGWVYSDNGKDINTYDYGSTVNYWIVNLGTSTDTSGLSVDASGNLVGGTAVKDGTGVMTEGGTDKIDGFSMADNGSYLAMVIYDAANKLYGVSNAAEIKGIAIDPSPTDADTIIFTNITTVDGDYMVANTATAVPEPTSGLLLLLGVAGLALRRRRA